MHLHGNPTPAFPSSSSLAQFTPDMHYPIPAGTIDLHNIHGRRMVEENGEGPNLIIKIECALECIAWTHPTKPPPVIVYVRRACAYRLNWISVSCFAQRYIRVHAYTKHYKLYMYIAMCKRCVAIYPNIIRQMDVRESERHICTHLWLNQPTVPVYVFGY